MIVNNIRREKRELLFSFIKRERNRKIQKGRTRRLVIKV